MEMGPEVQEQFVKAAERLGIERLHPEQERAILHSLQGRDALVVLPTGYGKSACYQIPSMILPKPVVVVSPLLALLEDQTRNLEKRNVPVVRVDGTVRGKARREAMARIAEGGPLLVMTTPETLSGEELRLALTETGFTVRAISKYRPSCAILGITTSPEVARRFAMNWGVAGVLCERTGSNEEMIERGIERGRELGYLQSGDLVVATAGMHGGTGTTDSLRVLAVG